MKFYQYRLKNNECQTIPIDYEKFGGKVTPICCCCGVIIKDEPSKPTNRS